MPAPFRLAAAAWGMAWVAGNVILAAVVLKLMGFESGDDLTIPQLAGAAIASWVPFAIALVVVSRQAGTGDLRDDYTVHVRPIDALAIPIGILLQLVAVPVLYWPLQQLFPDTFSQEALEERAVGYAESASAAGVVILVLVVVVGAPIVEELVYRGLIQRSLGAAIGPWRGLVVAAIWFSIVHFAPVEYPGLALAGLVFGIGVAAFDRVGPGMLAHAAFNATGLVLAFQRV